MIDRKPARRRRSLHYGGFTLIELVIVVLIIGILAAIVVPNYIKFAMKAKEAVVKENMHTVHLGIEMFSIETLGVYPTPADEAQLKALLPGGQWPPNPFDSAETNTLWNVDPASPGEISITNLPDGGYLLKGHGYKGILPGEIQSGS